MKILGTGLDGLVGSRIVELLKDQYEFESSGVDITDRNSIIDKIVDSDAPIVLHLAAKTSVDGCEEDKEEDIRHLSLRGAKRSLARHREQSEAISIVSRDRLRNPPRFGIASPFGKLRARNDKNKEKTAWAVNVYGTKNVVDACEKSKKKLIYISTDFVFDGSPKNAYLASEASTLAPARSASTGQAQKGYSEEDKPNPSNWYGKTKYEGEEIVKNSSISWIVARIAYPYRTRFVKKDFVRTLIEKLKRKESLQMVTDHIMSPTFIDDIANAVDTLIKNNSIGIFHVVGSEFVSPYEAALKIAKIFGFDQNNIRKTTRSEFFKNRAPRPFHLTLKNDKIQSLGVKMRGFEEGLKELKSQMSNLKSTS